MKIEQIATEFQPVSVTLETQEELNQFFNILLASADSADGGEPITDEEGAFALSIIESIEHLTTKD